MEHLDWPGKTSIRPAVHSRVLNRLSDFVERGRKDAILWSPFHRGPLFAHNHVVTVLDCINIQYSYRNDWRLPLLQANFGALLANATAIVAISNATRDAILDCFDVEQSKVIAIAGPTDFTAEMANAPEGDVCDTRFILMVTNTLPHKNTVRAARALAASRAPAAVDVLRVVGSLEAAGLAICEAAGLKVECYNGVDDETLRQWMMQCLFLFSPNLEEGLNLPIGEALALGGNVLCSDIPVHREFYDGAVLFCDPLDEHSMVRAVDDALARPHEWKFSGFRTPGRTFSDIARDYRSLFLRVSSGEFSSRRR